MFLLKGLCMTIAFTLQVTTLSYDSHNALVETLNLKPIKWLKFDNMFWYRYT